MPLQLARTLRRIASRLRGDWPLEETLPDFVRLHDELRDDFLEFLPELITENRKAMQNAECRMQN